MPDLKQSIRRAVVGKVGFLNWLLWGGASRATVSEFVLERARCRKRAFPSLPSTKVEHHCRDRSA